MRILVTGAAGFIGYNLCERLLRDGHEVVGLDNFSSGARRNAADLAAQFPRFAFIEHDLTQPLPDFGPLDQIYNEACPASPIDFSSKPLEILAVCSDGLRNLLELVRETGVRLLHTSTSEVYGNPQVHPQPESYWGHVNPIGPRSCYDEGKRFGEALLTAYERHFALDVRMVRIFNTYGPRMRPNDGRALPNFINQALRGEPLTVHGDGRQTRSFCFVTDQVEGQIRLMNSDVRGPVNLGNPVEITMLDIAQEVVRLTGSRSQIVHVERPKDDPEVRKPDISRARRELDWEPAVDRAEGLRHTVDWFRSLAAG